jgi:hypothetical protein
MNAVFADAALFPGPVLGICAVGGLFLMVGGILLGLLVRRLVVGKSPPPDFMD